MPEQQEIIRVPEHSVQEHFKVECMVNVVLVGLQHG